MINRELIFLYLYYNYIAFYYKNILNHILILLFFIKLRLTLLNHILFTKKFY